MSKQRMTLRKSNSSRVARTKRSVGQSRLTGRNMPPRIHLRAYTPEGNLVGVAQTNDRFMVALFTPGEVPMAPPQIFTGAQARTEAAALASKLTGRKVSF